MVDLQIFGWIGFIITVITFGIWNLDKYKKYFPLGNAVASVFFIIYEISITAWSLVALHSYILFTSIIKINKKDN